jgi:GGDEF domain-containing protein
LFKRRLPILYLINRKVGNPTLAVIFLTCLFFPSIKDKLNHEVGMFFLKRTGGFLSGIAGGSAKDFAIEGKVL